MAIRTQLGLRCQGLRCQVRDTRRRAPVLMVLALVGAVSACATGPSWQQLEKDAWEHVRATAAVDGELPRWPAGTELVVDVTGLSERDAGMVVRAFDAWLSGPDSPLTYRVARSGEAADVVVRDVGEIEEGYESMGLTLLEWERGRIVRAEVELARASRCGPFLSSLERERTALHEVGHVLGLGHSPRFSSIMHRATPGSDVDASDRAALRLLYGVRTFHAASDPEAPYSGSVESVAAPDEP